MDSKARYTGRQAKKKPPSIGERQASMGKDAMLHSLAAQVSYYSDLIQLNPEWEYAGVYAEMLTPTLIQMHPTCTQFAP